MTLYDTNAVHALNKYIWNELKTKLGWDAANYGGAIPITTPAQQPEFNAYDHPYIVYSYSVSARTNWILKEEQIAYIVYASEELDIRQAINVIDQALSRFDESAHDINMFLETHTAPVVSDANRAFDFKWTDTVSASSAQPPDQEGGRSDGLIMVRVSYTTNSDGAGLRNGIPWS